MLAAFGSAELPKETIRTASSNRNILKSRRWLRSIFDQFSASLTHAGLIPQTRADLRPPCPLGQNPRSTTHLPDLGNYGSPKQVVFGSSGSFRHAANTHARLGNREEHVGRRNKRHAGRQRQSLWTQTPDTVQLSGPVLQEL